ncbi:MAG TPA: histidine kinase dimerization/phospho-acceptor domain-containing protein, partial [Candidatus Saccharimonadales bacterium]|nr:histidine kinase dimerization/phospho-acceptor domain-containing protein [Candidatus Saccharimonadales bacterium]
MTTRHRILLGLLAYCLLATVAADMAGTALFRSRIRALATDRLQVESALLVRRLGPALEDPSANLQALVTDIAADLRLRLTVMGPQGTVLADSSVPASQLGEMDNHLDRPEIREARETGSGHSSRQSATLGVSMSYFARSLQGPGGRIGFLRLAVPTADLEAGLPAMRLTADLMVLGVLMAGSLLVYLLSLRVLRRVHWLTRTAGRIASGAHDLPATTLGGGPDIEALGAAMDRMRRALLDRIAELTGQHEMRDAVLAGMREGLLVVDTQRQVILANAALGEYLDLRGTPPAGRHLAEVIRDPLVFDAYKRTLEEREECRPRVELSFPAERIFDLLVEPLDTPDGKPLGAIGIFLDTTRTQVLERVRRTFVSDLSHEMRTPLASIAAAVETLEEAGPLSAEENANLLAILTRNVARLKALLEDLTDLSKIETGAITLDPEPVVLAEMVGDVFVSLGALAEAAGVRLLSEVPRDLRI